MERNSKCIIARVKETSGDIEGWLVAHTLDAIPPCLENQHTSYSIEPISRLVKREIFELKEGETIHDSFGKEWTITDVL